MIAYISGTVLETWGNTCILVTDGGIGYALGLPAHTFSQLPPKEGKAAFYTSLVVREDAQELFGFATFEEKLTFEALRGISKIGARTALAILSAFRPADLQRIVMDADIAALTRVPGIGQKTAQHILLELKYRLNSLPASQARPTALAQPPVFADSLAALRNLGYEDDECAPALREILKAEPDLDTGGAIRAALKILAQGKA